MRRASGFVLAHVSHCVSQLSRRLLGGPGHLLLIAVRVRSPNRRLTARRRFRLSIGPRSPPHSGWLSLRRFTGRSGSDTTSAGFARLRARFLRSAWTKASLSAPLAFASPRVIVFQVCAVIAIPTHSAFRYVGISVALGFQLGDALGIGLDIGLGRRSASNSDWGCLRLS